MKKITILFLLMISIASLAQERVERKPPIISKAVGTLMSASGWYFDKESGKWNRGINKIDGVDRFDQFDKFELCNLTYDDKEYLLLRKSYEIGHYTIPKKKKEWSGHKAHVAWIFSREDFKAKLDSLTDSDNELMLDMLATGFDVASENEVALKVLKEDEAKRDKLVIKFRIIKDKNLVRFFIYAREEIGEDFFNIKNLGNNQTYNSYSNEGQIIDSDKLYENFYFETDRKIFLDFIKSPFK